jgi:hypothetical protein
MVVAPNMSCATNFKLNGLYLYGTQGHHLLVKLNPPHTCQALATLKPLQCQHYSASWSRMEQQPAAVQGLSYTVGVARCHSDVQNTCNYLWHMSPQHTWQLGTKQPCKRHLSYSNYLQSTLPGQLPTYKVLQLLHQQWCTSPAGGQPLAVGLTLRASNS